MDTIIRRKAQLSVAAVAALAIFAVAAVMLLAGGTPAQATSAALTPDDGAALQRPQQTDKTPTTSRHAPPPACPGETGNTNTEAAEVVASGHVALFDVWWNPEELELTNSSCPPTVTHVPAEYNDRNEPISPARDDRSPSNIDIAKTVIHIPNSAKVTLNETDYPKGEYDALWKADAREDRDIDGNGTPDGVGDSMVWALPACPPAGAPAADDLCIIFSAALLNPADWVTADGKPNGKIEYQLDHVHQTDIDKQDPRYALAYDKDDLLLWDSSDVGFAKMPVAPGGYERPQLFFTDRGTYEFQVHITGNPNHDSARTDGLKLVSEDKSVSSDVREYIIHVGALADLGVTATATSDNPAPGDTVTVTVTASNHGPEAVPATGVDVTLPPGLTYSSHTPAGDAFDDDNDDGVPTWKAGSLAAGATNTLAITATVDAETHGKELAVKAAISGTETLKITETDEQGNKTVERYPVLVLDPNSSNDTAAVTVTVATSPNTDPMFFVTRSIAEHSASGTSVGDPVRVKDPNSGDTLTFSLTGTGSDRFTTSSVSGGAQIAVASGAILDYEHKAVYDLVLGVSDGKDADGNDNDAVDHTIGVQINLEDVANDPPTLLISASAQSVKKGVHVTVTATPSDLPAEPGPLTYRWIQRSSLHNEPTTYHGSTAPSFSTTMESGHGPITLYFSAEVSWTKDGVTTKVRSSNEVAITWTD